MKETNQFYQGLLPQVEQMVEYVTQMSAEYKVIVKQYRTSFGSSVAQHVLRRTRKKHALKENVAKQERKVQLAGKEQSDLSLSEKKMDE